MWFSIALCMFTHILPSFWAFRMSLLAISSWRLDHLAQELRQFHGLFGGLGGAENHGKTMGKPWVFPWENGDFAKDPPFVKWVNQRFTHGWFTHDGPVEIMAPDKSPFFDWAMASSSQTLTVCLLEGLFFNLKWDCWIGFNDVFHGIFLGKLSSQRSAGFFQWDSIPRYGKKFHPPDGL